MVKVILPTLLTFFICIRSYAQQYYFMNDSASWKVDYFSGDDICLGHCAEWKYYIAGDTTINSILFKKLRSAGHNFIYEWYTDTYTGAIRQNQNKKKVYFVWGNQPDTTANLLFDFNLSLGDTLKGILAEEYPLVVDSVDSILVNNQFQKRYWFTNDNFAHLYIIEGIGSGLGLLEPISTYGFETFWFLTCFQVDDQLLYSTLDTSIYNCDISFPAYLDSKHSEPALKIFPNPFSDFVSVTSPFQSSSILSVMNSQGDIILKRQLLPLEKISLSAKELGNNRVIFFRLISDEGATKSALVLHVF